jgi:hypothetical protein
VLECGDCAAEVERTRESLRLFQLSGHAAAERWQGVTGPGRTRRLRKGAVFALAAAAIAALFVLYPRQRPTPKEVFTPIPYVIPAAPYERTEVVRMDVPVTALISAGIRIQSAGAASSVPADVLIGQDGRPLAVSLPGEENR